MPSPWTRATWLAERRQSGRVELEVELAQGAHREHRHVGEVVPARREPQVREPTQRMFERENLFQPTEVGAGALMLAEGEGEVPS
jgi:hypothetical protein